MPASGLTWGWCPPSHSSGQSRSQGSITKTGNTHARRLLVEAAWHHRKPYRTPRGALATPVGAGPCRPPGSADTPATSGYTSGGSHFTDRKKRPVVANVAIARELAGWCWSLAIMDD